MPPQDVLRWDAFEDVVAAHFRMLGAEKVKQNLNMSGHQIDIYCEEKTTSSQLIRSAIECKFYQKPVGRSIVTHFAVTSDYLKRANKIDKSIIVAYQGFTKDAHLVAKDMNVELVSFAELEHLVETKNVDYKKLGFTIPERKPNIKYYLHGAVVDNIIAQSEKKRLPLKFKKTIFVLMPFSLEMYDYYWYGIRGCVDKLGYKCIRADEIEHNSDILKEVFDHIKRAEIVIAEVTEKNPNVYYEIGYAHALGIEPILIAKKGTEIPFDLKTHNHILYDSITNLESLLSKRLKALITKN